MNELIQISTGDQGSPVVSARELHGFLEVKTKFATWIDRRINEFGFIKYRDFTVAPISSDHIKKEVFPNFGKNSIGGRPELDYALTLDMAKELSMVERNAKGKEARLYFIEKEKQLNALAFTAAPTSTEQLLIQTLSQQTQLLSDAQQMIAQLRADVDLIQRGRKPVKPALARPNVQSGPPAASTPPNGNLRKLLQHRITEYCAYHQSDYGQTYTYLYRRLNDVYGVNVHRLNRAEGENLLDTIERYGRLGDLYKLATNELVYPEREPAGVAVRKPTLDTMSEQDLQVIIRRTFSEDSYLQYAQLRANLIEASEFVGLALAKSRAETFIARAVKLGYLLKSWEPGQRYERYRLNLERISLYSEER